LLSEDEHLINIFFPKFCLNEQRYILNIIFGDFFGLDFRILEYDEPNIKITRNDDVFYLSLTTIFFQKAEQAWLKPESMPVLPLENWTPQEDNIHCVLVDKAIPVLFGQPGLIKSEKCLHLNLDVFGSIFFMLSRYEELITTDRDKHDRFPAYASVAFKAKFLGRPIVNEYLEILWSCVELMWPDLQRKQREEKNFITCDVDWPFDPSLYSFKNMVFKAGREVLKQYAPLKAITTLSKFTVNKIGFSVKDEFRENISWIMDVNEKVGNKVAFYFITRKTSALDTDEDFDSTKMRQLLREIHRRGHEIGIHPGYHCYKDQQNFQKTVLVFKRILKEEGIKQDAIGGRMHFLRWDSSRTAMLWEKNGFDYDSSLMYADQVGFRCGTSYEFTMYNLVNRQPFRLKQRPLIVMECTIIDASYESLGYSEKSMERFKEFKKRSHAYNGTYTLLWHNSSFTNKQDKIFYKALIK
jgi:hypothetical protein